MRRSVIFPAKMDFGIPRNPMNIYQEFLEIFSYEFLGLRGVNLVNLDWEFLGIPWNSQL